MDMLLHSVQDDFSLRADGDTERWPGLAAVFFYYLTDTAGNYLTDTAGNRLIAGEYTTVYPQILHAMPDDFQLNAE